MRYKDVVREQILHAETAEDAISSDEDSDNNNGGSSSRKNRNDNGGERRRGLAYDEEQERLRKGFLGSIAEHDGEKSGAGSDGEDSSEEGDGLLKVWACACGRGCVCRCRCRCVCMYVCTSMCFVFWCCVKNEKNYVKLGLGRRGG